MKKILFSTIAVIVFTQFATSQNTAGIKAGLNISTLHQTFTPKEIYTQSFKSLLGYQFGGYYKVKLNQKWNIGGELNFSVIGAKVPYITQEGFDTIGTTHYRNINIGYLEIPLMLQYNLHKFYISLGPGIGFHLFSNGSASDSGSYIVEHKAVDVSANMLAGYRITKKLDANLRYSHGLTNIAKNNNLGGSYNTKVSLTNRFLNISLLYSLK